MSILVQDNLTASKGTFDTSNASSAELSFSCERDDSDEMDGIPLSDIESLAESEQADVVPHQHLTINNTLALVKARESIAINSLPFSAHQTVTSNTQTNVDDINIDLSRELAFYKQCLDATIKARALLRGEGIPFTRPGDYFAEMVKSDEHMGIVKSKIKREAASKKAAIEARRQRDLKKFGKQVQVARLQEREKVKRETLDKIKTLQRRRKGTDIDTTHDGDIFDVVLENSSKAGRARNQDTRIKLDRRRQKKDAKFGFGGRKRFAKSGDAMSSGDLREFSTRKMKSPRKAAQRPGKARRAMLHHK